MNNTKRVKIGDLVKLNRDLFDNGDYLNQIKHKIVSLQTANKHFFNESVELSACPPGFSEELDKATCTIEYTDVAMIIEFSDSSHLSAKILTSHGWGWIPTAYLESA